MFDLMLILMLGVPLGLGFGVGAAIVLAGENMTAKRRRNTVLCTTVGLFAYTVGIIFYLGSRV